VQNQQRMKCFYVPFIAFALFITACKNKQAGGNTALQSEMKNKVHQFDTAHFTQIQWIDSIVNFGTVEKGKQLKIRFRFKNTGHYPLFISDVRPSCGCTIAHYPKNAIAPGEQAEIVANFDSNHGYPGKVRKTVQVVTNTQQSNSMLVFTGEVKDNQSLTHNQ
jgi:hypothetical protein